MNRRTAMTSDELLEQFLRLQIWTSKGQRAPHKPLLALWAIGRCLGGEQRLVSYEDSDRALTKLLRRFGPHRRTIHTEAPFWRLQGDGVWEVRDAEVVTLTSKGDAHKSSLLKHDIHAGFPEPIHAALHDDVVFAERIAHALVGAHFPPSIHDEVLEAVGIESGYEQLRRKRRDRGFSEKVLAAYGHRCAVCGFGVRLDDRPIALEAAHIRWHQAHGPDRVQNALSLCALHHRLFDKGAFTLSPHSVVVVARTAGGRGFADALGRFDRKRLAVPTSPSDVPDPQFSAWHAREVFGSPSDDAS